MKTLKNRVWRKNRIFHHCSGRENLAMIPWKISGHPMPTTEARKRPQQWQKWFLGEKNSMKKIEFYLTQKIFANILEDELHKCTVSRSVHACSHRRRRPLSDSNGPPGPQLHHERERRERGERREWGERRRSENHTWDLTFLLGLLFIMELGPLFISFIYSR